MKFLAVNLAAAALGAVLALPSTRSLAEPVDEGTFVCASSGADRTHCPIGSHGGVHFLKRLSDRRCIAGRDWGVDSQGVWVAHGCTAQFAAIGGAPAASADAHVATAPHEGPWVCASPKRGHAHCLADTTHGIHIAKQLSKRRCVAGDNWGIDAEGIWTAQGCAARFAMGGAGVSANAVGPDGAGAPPSHAAPASVTIINNPPHPAAPPVTIINLPPRRPSFPSDAVVSRRQLEDERRSFDEEQRRQRESLRNARDETRRAREAEKAAREDAARQQQIREGQDDENRQAGEAERAANEQAAREEAERQRQIKQGEEEENRQAREAEKAAREQAAQERAAQEEAERQRQIKQGEEEENRQAREAEKAAQEEAERQRQIKQGEEDENRQAREAEKAAQEQADRDRQNKQGDDP